jgi:hypothetical protein
MPPQYNAEYRVYWNDLDHDLGDLANEIHFYRIIAKINGSVTAFIQKLVKDR